MRPPPEMTCSAARSASCSYASPGRFTRRPLERAVAFGPSADRAVRASDEWLIAPTPRPIALRHSTAKLPTTSRSVLEWHPPQSQHRRTPRTSPLGSRRGIGQYPGQLGLKPLQRVPFCARLDAFQHKPVDRHANSAHIHPRISASESGRSIFWASSRAASST